MILDNFLMFTGTSNGASAGITAGANTDLPTTGTQNSSNTIDLHMAGIPVLAANQGARDMGIGDDPAIKILVQVITAITGGTTLSVALQGAPDNGSGGTGSFYTFYASAAIAEASLTAGQRLLDMDMPRPPPGNPIPRFLKLVYTSAGTHSAGAVEGCLVLDRFDQVYNGTNNAISGGYPAGITVTN
jgi:hypothetical protein